MLEYETFAYLEPPKTGTSFIHELLKRFSREAVVREDKHAPVGSEYDRNKFYFISVRDPMDLYLSLYSYGCGKELAFKTKPRRVRPRRGSVWARLVAAGHQDMYDRTPENLRRWLRFVLDPAHASLLDQRDYASTSQRLGVLLGFQSYRFLKLALPDIDSNLSDCRTKDDVRAALAEHSIVNFSVRVERFREDLATLVTEHLKNSLNDVDAALEFVNTQEPINSSHRIDKSHADPLLDGELLAALAEREWFLCEQYGYGGPERRWNAGEDRAAAPAPSRIGHKERDPAIAS